MGESKWKGCIWAKYYNFAGSPDSLPSIGLGGQGLARIRTPIVLGAWSVACIQSHSVQDAWDLCRLIDNLLLNK